MLDHSKRVSAKENVSALYALVGLLGRGFVAWVGKRPVRRFFRKQSVSTWIALAAIVLSVAAILLLIGIGQTQLIAAEDPGKHVADLFRDGWFDIGLGFAAMGALIGVVAVAANGSQAKSVGEFPDLDVRVLLRADFDAYERLHPDGHGRPVRLAYVRLLVRSKEHTRDVSLPISLWLAMTRGDKDPPFGASAISLSPISWEPALADLPNLLKVLGSRPLEEPLQVRAGTQREGDVFFAVPAELLGQLAHSDRGFISMVDHGSGRAVEFRHGYPNDRPSSGLQASRS